MSNTTLKSFFRSLAWAGVMVEMPIHVFAVRRDCKSGRNEFIHIYGICANFKTILGPLLFIYLPSVEIVCVYIGQGQES